MGKLLVDYASKMNLSKSHTPTSTSELRSEQVSPQRWERRVTENPRAPKRTETIMPKARSVPLKRRACKGGGGGTHIMRGRSLSDHKPSHPYNAMSGFRRPGRRCLHQARSAVRCSASRMKSELHPAKNCLSGGHRHRVRYCIAYRL